MKVSSSILGALVLLGLAGSAVAAPAVPVQIITVADESSAAAPQQASNDNSAAAPQQQASNDNSAAAPQQQASNDSSAAGSNNTIASNDQPQDLSAAANQDNQAANQANNAATNQASNNNADNE